MNQRLKRELRKMKDGIPVDPRDWTERDWNDLWIAITWATTRIKRRHREGNLHGDDLKDPDDDLPF